MKTLGELIQLRMKAVGIERKSELARRVGVSPAYIGDLINNTAKTKSGTYTPSREVVQKLSDVLDISESEILKSMDYLREDDSDDDELVADGLFSGYYELDDEQRKLARRQIAAIIRSFTEDDFPE